MFKKLDKLKFLKAKIIWILNTHRILLICEVVVVDCWSSISSNYKHENCQLIYCKLHLWPVLKFKITIMLGQWKEVLWTLCPLSGVENMDTSYQSRHKILWRRCKHYTCNIDFIKFICNFLSNYKICICEVWHMRAWRLSAYADFLVHPILVHMF